jgi:hypothetical protein
MMPNTLVEAPSHGIAPWPGGGRSANFLPPSQGAMPCVEPHLERLGV